MITNGKLENIRFDWDSHEMVIQIEPMGKGQVDLRISHELIDRVANIGM